MTRNWKIAGAAALAALALAGSGWARQADDEMDSAARQAASSAPGGPWRLVGYSNVGFNLINADSVRADPATGTASAETLSVLRHPKSFEGIGAASSIQFRSEAQCSDFGERTLHATFRAADGTVLVDTSEGFRTTFTTHDAASMYTQNAQRICNPSQLAGKPGYPSAASAIAALALPN